MGSLTSIIIPFALAASAPMLVHTASANDAFNSPTVLTAFPMTANGTNVDATLEPGEPLPMYPWWENAAASAWFRWTSPITGPIQIDTLGSDFDSMLAVWRGNEMMSLELLAHNDQFGGGDQSAVFISASANVTYQIAVYGWSDSRGLITLNVTNDITSKISGTVTGPDETTLLQGIDATAYQWNDSGWEWFNSGSTDASGQYTISGLPAGTYRVKFDDWLNGNYASEFYDNVPNLDSGTDIVVPAETTITGINASLTNASKITGTVTGPVGTMLLNDIQVTAFRWYGSGWQGLSVKTDVNGEYTIGGLHAGTYRVQFEDRRNGNFITEVYDNAPDLDSGTDIVVPAGAIVTGIDASLAIGSKITGTVTGPDGFSPLQGVYATAHRWNGSWWEWVKSGSTDASGQYTIGGLHSGTYRVKFDDWSNGNYASEFYDNAPDLDSGTDIVVPAETTVPGINASLAIASKISGTVTGPDGYSPLQGVNAAAYRWNDFGSSWDYVNSRNTDANGVYTIDILPAGTYRVQFGAWNGDYISEVYDNVPNIDSGTDIFVPAGATVTGIDASLAFGSSKITGTITGPDGSSPLQGVNAVAYSWNDFDSTWEWVRSGSTDDSGQYTIGGLLAGTYRVEFYDWNGDYYTEIYDNAPSLNSGKDIVVPAETTVTDINASLAIASKISGTVTGPDGTKVLRDIEVRAYGWNGSWSVRTDDNGEYTISPLPAGTYQIRFDDWRGIYASEFYDNAPNLNPGTDIVVPAETTVTGINASLAIASKISGTVTGPNGFSPLRDIYAEAYLWNGSWWEGVKSGSTDANGQYTIGGLPAGTYRVQFEDRRNGDFITEVYDNAPDLDSGTDIVVPAEMTVPGINASLAIASKISGTVTGPDGFSPLQGVYATAHRWNGSWWEWVKSGSTDASGQYTIGGLPAGTYRVQFEDRRNGDFITEVYDNAPNLDSGTDIVVPAETTVTGINASLANTTTPGPPRIVAVSQIVGNDWRIFYTGTVGTTYILQETLSLTSAWGDVGESFIFQQGTNETLRHSSGPMIFWQIREYP